MKLANLASPQLCACTCMVKMYAQAHAYTYHLIALHAIRPQANCARYSQLWPPGVDTAVLPGLNTYFKNTSLLHVLYYKLHYCEKYTYYILVTYVATVCI